MDGIIPHTLLVMFVGFKAFILFILCIPVKSVLAFSVSLCFCVGL